MKTIKKNSIFLIMLLLFPAYIFSQKSNISYYKHELTFGIGYVNGFEKHVFNVPEDVGINNALGINMGYIYYINKEIGIGLRGAGYEKKLPAVSIIYPDETYENIRFDVTAVNFDAEFRYIFTRSKIMPYGFVLLGSSFGEVSDDESKLRFSGYNFGGGAGIELTLSPRWRVSAEAIGTFGSAEWDSRPFLNSKSDEFIPSMTGLFINLSYTFGPVKGKIR